MTKSTWSPVQLSAIFLILSRTVHYLLHYWVVAHSIFVAISSLSEEGGEGVVSLASHLFRRQNTLSNRIGIKGEAPHVSTHPTMLKAVKLPAGISHLATCLTLSS